MGVNLTPHMRHVGYPQLQGLLGRESVSLQQARAAQQLLGTFGFPSEFQAPAAPQRGIPLNLNVNLNLNLYADLMVAPPGYGPQAMQHATGLLGQCMPQWGMDPCLHGGRSGRAMYSMFAQLFGHMCIQAPTLGRPTQVSGTDKFATHHSCREGKHNPSNLNDSDHIKLAIYNILNRDGTGPYKGLPPAELAKKLEEEYGMKSEVTKVKSKEGEELVSLKFENGAVFSDGAGDGALELRDYDFKGAIEDITKRTGIKPEDFAKHAAQFKQGQEWQAQYQRQLAEFQQMAGGLFGNLGFDFQGAFGPGLGLPMAQPLGAMGPMGAMGLMPQGQRELFPMNQVCTLFLQAYLFAGMEERQYFM